MAACLVTVAAAVLLGVACGSGGETLEERWARLDVAEPKIVSLGDWTDEEEAAITREVKSVQVHHHGRFGVVTSEFTLYISTERELLTEPFRERYGRNVHQPDLPAWFTCDGFTFRQAIFIILETCDEEERARGGSHRARVLPHPPAPSWGGEPPHADTWTSWLAEGSAIYASAHHAEEHGRWTVDWRREAARLA